MPAARIASATPTAAKPFSRNRRDASATTRSRFSATRSFVMRILIWGVMVGTATGLTAVVFSAIVSTRWFTEQRGLVVDILTASNATGQLVFLPLAAWLEAHYGWRAARADADRFGRGRCGRNPLHGPTTLRPRSRSIWR